MAREARTLNQSLSKVMQKQRNSLITFDTQLKTALRPKPKKRQILGQGRKEGGGGGVAPRANQIARFAEYKVFKGRGATPPPPPPQLPSHTLLKNLSFVNAVFSILGVFLGYKLCKKKRGACGTLLSCPQTREESKPWLRELVW